MNDLSGSLSLRDAKKDEGSNDEALGMDILVGQFGFDR
jgi:hypothetical protein